MNSESCICSFNKKKGRLPLDRQISNRCAWSIALKSRFKRDSPLMIIDYWQKLIDRGISSSSPGTKHKNTSIIQSNQTMASLYKRLQSFKYKELKSKQQIKGMNRFALISLTLTTTFSQSMTKGRSSLEEGVYS